MRGSADSEARVWVSDQLGQSPSDCFDIHAGAHPIPRPRRRARYGGDACRRLTHCCLGGRQGGDEVSRKGLTFKVVSSGRGERLKPFRPATQTHRHGGVSSHQGSGGRQSPDDLFTQDDRLVSIGAASTRRRFFPFPRSFQGIKGASVLLTADLVGEQHPNNSRRKLGPGAEAADHRAGGTPVDGVRPTHQSDRLTIRLEAA